MLGQRGLYHLAVEDVAGRGGALCVCTDFESTGSAYLRNTFLARRFYLAPPLGRGDVWFFVLENKVLAGREVCLEGDAQSRPLVVCFFTQVDSAADEVVARRTDRSSLGMAPLTLTPAELAMHLGFMPPLDPTRGAGETESLVERVWLAVLAFVTRISSWLMPTTITRIG